MSYVNNNSFKVYSGGTGVSKVELGTITEAISCRVTVVDYGDPTFTMVVPYRDEYRDMLAVENYVEIKAGERDIDNFNEQTPIHFYINKNKIDTRARTITISGEIEQNYLRNSMNVYFNYVDTGTTATTGINQLLKMIARPVGSDPYPTFVNNLAPTTESTWSTPVTFANGLEFIKGKEGSYVDTFGGKVWKRGNKIWWEKPSVGVLGNNRGFRIEYGKNITGISVEVDISEVVNGVIHYAFEQNHDGEVNGIGLIFDNGLKRQNVKRLGTKIWKNGRVIAMDWTQNDPRPVNASQVNALGTAWNNANAELNEPKISVKVDFMSLRNASNYEDFKDLESVALGDLVTVYYAPMDINIQSSVVGYEYDAIKDEYTKLEIGNKKSNLFNIINSVYGKTR